MSLVFPQKHRAAIWRLIAASINGALEKLRPDQRRVLADLAVFCDRNIDDNNLPIENILRR